MFDDFKIVHYFVMACKTKLIATLPMMTMMLLGCSHVVADNLTRTLIVDSNWPPWKLTFHSYLAIFVPLPLDLCQPSP